MTSYLSIEALTVSGLDPSTLVLEITEGAMMHETDAIIARLEALKALGVKLALDDFGTGYSSFSYLQRLSIDVVKFALGQFDLGKAAAVSLVYYLIILVVCWVFYTVMTNVDAERKA